jgi:aryl-alcohol dehydrogenase-like predicted oxidoreductase
VAAPIVGATKVPHFDAAVRAMDLTLSREDIAFLEEPYKAHEIVGALARTDSNGI